MHDRDAMSPTTKTSPHERLTRATRRRAHDKAEAHTWHRRARDKGVL